MRTADYIADRLVQLGARDVFMVTGGGAMHLNDAFGHRGDLRVTCCHHEQACAFAAEAYARVAGIPAIVNVTTGPGGVNALNGVFAAWTDSIPMIVVSGQVRRETLVRTYPWLGLRQLGDQELDIVALARHITKYAEMVEHPSRVRAIVERAWRLAVTGRPGPTWVDVPIDVQGSQIDPDGQAPDWQGVAGSALAPPQLADACRHLVDRLRQAKRPVLVVGSGVRYAGALELCEQVMGRLRIPVVTGWTAVDLLPSDHELLCGRPGDLGTRAGNFTIQNADLLLVVGTRLSIRMTGYNWPAFAPRAWKAQVDADPAELRKPSVRIDLPIEADAKAFLEMFASVLDESAFDGARYAGWLAWCKERGRRYPVVQPKHRESRDTTVNPYHFIEMLFDVMPADAIVACGDGTANVATFQAACVKRGHRVFCNTGDASMGYDLPAAIGAAVAAPGRTVVCLAGDGSIQFNIQELETVRRLGLPIKIFVLNNNGYLSIRQSQRNFFGRLIGADQSSGITFPDTLAVAAAYGLPAVSATAEAARDTLREVFQRDGPVVCEVMLDAEQPFEPRLAARRLASGEIVSPSLEDMWPHLDPAELAANMPDWDAQPQ